MPKVHPEHCREYSMVSVGNQIRATSHTRLRARDHYTLSTLVGGKGVAGPSSLPTMLEGLSEYVNARWMYESTWIHTWHQMDHVSWSLGLFLIEILWR